MEPGQVSTFEHRQGVELFLWQRLLLRHQLQCVVKDGLFFFGVSQRHGSQYAWANSTRVRAGSPHRTHTPLPSASASSGITRIVARVSSLIRASHSAEPHQKARMNPRCSFMTRLNEA